MIMRIPNICRFAGMTLVMEQIVYHDKRKECTKKDLQKQRRLRSKPYIMIK